MVAGVSIYQVYSRTYSCLLILLTSSAIPYVLAADPIHNITPAQVAPADHEVPNYNTSSTSFLREKACNVYPFAIGLFIFVFTWMIVYYDSYIPGVVPPTPFSHKKYRVKSGHTFHLQYVLAFVNGISATIVAMLFL